MPTVTRPEAPTQHDVDLAQEYQQKHLRDKLNQLVHDVGTVEFRLGEESHGFVVPPVVLRLILEAMEQVAQGHAVAIVPYQMEMTTQEAANLLNVSRPFLIKLLTEGQIPHRRVGNRRKVKFCDVMQYREHIDNERRGVLDELVAEAQEHGFGYGR